MSKQKSYSSFQYGGHAAWSWPSSHEVSDLMRHPLGIVVLSFFLLLNYSLASVVLSMPVSAQDPLMAEEWVQDATLRARLDLQYHVEVPIVVGQYLQQRGAFAARIAAGEQSADAASAWQTTAREVKEKFIAMKVPASLKETHLGLVVAIGLDEVAADQLRQIWSAHGDAAGAEAAFSIAEERLTVVLQSAPWLTQ